MLPVIRRYEPPKRRLRIKNKVRFIVFVLVVLSAIVADGAVVRYEHVFKV